MKDTFKVIKTDQTGLEWCNSDPPAPELPTLFIVASARYNGEKAIRRDIVLRAPHEVIDGIGTLILLNNYLTRAAEAYAQPQDFKFVDLRKEHLNLTPPFRVIAAIPVAPSLEQQIFLEHSIAASKAFREHEAIASLPCLTGAKLPGVHKRIAIKLSPERTQQLLNACKSIGFTVTHAFHAAIGLVLRDLQPRTEVRRSVRYISYCLINHRKDCLEPYSGSKHPVSVIHSVPKCSLVVDFEVPSDRVYPPEDHSSSRKAEFLKGVLQVREFYQSVRDEKHHLALSPLYFRMATPTATDEVLLGSVLPQVPEPDPSPTATISSIGRIDDIVAHEHGPFKLDNPWVTGEELRNGLGTFLGTWKGQLTFSAAYNDAWHDQDEVLAFLQRCEEIIFGSLIL